MRTNPTGLKEEDGRSNGSEGKSWKGDNKMEEEGKSERRDNKRVEFQK